jgi:hypothetical protein
MSNMIKIITIDIETNGITVLSTAKKYCNKYIGIITNTFSTDLVVIDKEITLTEAIGPSTALTPIIITEDKQLLTNSNYTWYTCLLTRVDKIENISNIQY